MQNTSLQILFGSLSQSIQLCWSMSERNLNDEHTDVIDYSIHDMIYEYTEGKWIFTQFELVR